VKLTRSTAVVAIARATNAPAAWLLGWEQAGPPDPHGHRAEESHDEGAEGREGHEGRVELAPEAARAAGIEVEAAGPARIARAVPLSGRVATNEDALAHIVPRYPGVAKSVRKRLGDPVAADEILAVIESNESLHPYEVRSRLAGTVIFKEIAPGEFVANDREIYVVADLATVWVDLQVHRSDFSALRVGQRVRVSAGDGSAPVESEIAYLSPVGSERTQTLLARVVLPNPDGAWRPGLFVGAEVEFDAVTVPVAVREAAVQRMGGADVVFRNLGDVFEAQPVELGRRGGGLVEVVSGLAAGERYAAAGSFVLKADVGKAGAGHDH
jgi:cobalt-zinc-cadmium efflux system membrane fusion protein